MKVCLSLLFSSLMFAQIPVQPPTVPSVPAAPAAPAVAEKGDTVIAIFEDGSKMTLDEFRALVPGLPQQFQQMAQQDRERFLHYYAMMKTLSHMAETEKLDQRSPYKEALAYSRLSTLTDIKLKEVMDSIAVTDEDVQKTYNENKDPYKSVKVSAIYVAFGDATASAASSSAAASHVSKKLTEEEAKAKADKLVAEARGGADFKTLVKENSDDETSRDKGGDFGTWRMTDNVPDLMRPVVFGLKQGDVGEPVRQAHGFYIFHADEVAYTPLNQVRDSIVQRIRQQRFQQWTMKLDGDTKVQFPTKPAAPPAPSAGK